MNLHHLTLATDGRLPMYRDEADVLAVLETVLAIAGDYALAFSLVDDHLHLLVGHALPGRVARSVRQALQARLPDVGWQATHIKPVVSRSHLRNLIPYFLRQPLKHDLPCHPALWRGSCFQDLLRVRLLPGFDLTHLLRACPSLRQRAVFEAVGMTPLRLQPVDDHALRAAGVARLADLAAGVLGVPDLHGNRPAVVSARTLAVHAAKVAGFKATLIAGFLSVTPQAVRRLAKRAPVPGGLPSLRRRLALDARVAQAWVRPQRPPRSA